MNRRDGSAYGSRISQARVIAVREMGIKKTPGTVQSRGLLLTRIVKEDLEMLLTHGKRSRRLQG